MKDSLGACRENKGEAGGCAESGEYSLFERNLGVSRDGLVADLREDILRSPETLYIFSN